MRMIVCICHNVNDKRIAQCAREGVRSVKGLCMATRCGTRCGKCLCTARDVLNEALQQAEPTPAARNALAGSVAPANPASQVA